MASSEVWTGTSGPRDDSGQNLARKQDNGAGCLKCGDHCPGLELHEWRNCCTQCKCRREDHDVFSRDVTTLFGKLQISQDTPVAKGYAWVPPGISSMDKLEEYMNALPDDRVPRIGTSGERARQRNLVLQLPLQDFDEDFCGSELTDAERRDFKLFRQKRDYQAYGMGTVKESIEQDMKCYKCESTIPEGGIAVSTSHTGADVCWHPGCFCCSTCQILLVDLLYFYRGSSIYCGRHYGESLHPRCYGCDELIFAGEYTRDMSKQQWHATHFNCFNCNNSLTGHRYVNRDTNHYCLKCYEKLFAFPCEHCGQKIGTDVKDLSFNNKHWHEQCFNCSKCKKSLVDQQFTQKTDKIYCAQCHKETFLGKCDGCSQHFDPGDKKMEYQGKNWHEKCFTCKECKKPVGTKSFIAKDDKVICQPCYEDKYAKKCEKCRKVRGDLHGGHHLQGHPLAQGVLRLHPLQEAHVRGALHLQGQQPLLYQLLRGSLRKEVCQVHQAYHWSWWHQVHLLRELQLAQRLLQLHRLQDLAGRQGVHQRGWAHPLSRLHQPGGPGQGALDGTAPREQSHNFSTVTRDLTNTHIIWWL